MQWLEYYRPVEVTLTLYNTIQYNASNPANNEPFMGVIRLLVTVQILPITVVFVDNNIVLGIKMDSVTDLTT